MPFAVGSVVLSVQGLRQEQRQLRMPARFLVRFGDDELRSDGCSGDTLKLHEHMTIQS